MKEKIKRWPLNGIPKCLKADTLSHDQVRLVNSPCQLVTVFKAQFLLRLGYLCKHRVILTGWQITSMVKNAQKVTFGRRDETCPECTFGQQKCSQTNMRQPHKSLKCVEGPKIAFRRTRKHKIHGIPCGQWGKYLHVVRKRNTSMSMASKSQSLIFEESN